MLLQQSEYVCVFSSVVISLHSTSICSSLIYDMLLLVRVSVEMGLWVNLLSVSLVCDLFPLVLVQIDTSSVLLTV